MKTPIIIAEYTDINGFSQKRRAITNGQISVPMALRSIDLPIRERLKIDYSQTENTLDSQPPDIKKKEFELDEIVVTYKYKEV